MTTVADDFAAKATSFDNFLSEVVPVMAQKLSETPLLVMDIPCEAGTAMT